MAESHTTDDMDRTPTAPVTASSLANDGTLEGAAVIHDDYGTGEVTATRITDAKNDITNQTAHVEFGEAGVTTWVSPVSLTIEWDYYVEHPEHATDALADAVDALNQARESQAVPFETENTTDADVGVREFIVDLFEHRDSESVTWDGRCYYCGYDRGTYTRHTEVPGHTVDCNHCDRRLVNTDGESA